MLILDLGCNQGAEVTMCLAAPLAKFAPRVEARAWDKVLAPRNAWIVLWKGRSHPEHGVFIDDAFPTTDMLRAGRAV